MGGDSGVPGDQTVTEKTEYCKVQAGTIRCKRPVMVKRARLCSAHYKRVQRYGEAGTPIVLARQPLPTFTVPGKTSSLFCRVRGCKEKIVYPKHRLCAAHYQRARVQWRKGRPVLLKPIRPRKGRRKDAVA